MKTAADFVASPLKSSFFLNRNFGLLWIGQSISALGDIIYFVTLSLWIATIIAKNEFWAPTAVSGVTIATALPALILGPFAGIFVDRWDKRLTMMRMDVIRALLMLLLIPLTGLMPLPFVTGPLPVFWQIGSIYGVVFAASICGRFFSPARSVKQPSGFPQREGDEHFVWVIVSAGQPRTYQLMKSKHV